MSVGAPNEVLARLGQLANGYVGPGTRWDRVSNPIEDDLAKRVTVVAQSSPRNDISERAGVALLYALQSQDAAVRASVTFSRIFTDFRGRRTMLENGVLRDLLASGAVAPADLSDDDAYLVTGLGSTRMREIFSGLRD